MKRQKNTQIKPKQNTFSGNEKLCESCYLPSSVRFTSCCEIWIKCRIKVLKDLFPICCRAGFFRPEKINFKINEINRNTSIYFSLYNLQFTLVVSYEIRKFWNQHDGGRFLLFKRSAAINIYSRNKEVLKYRKNWKGFLKAHYKLVKKFVYVTGA